MSAIWYDIHIMKLHLDNLGDAVGSFRAFDSVQAPDPSYVADHFVVALACGGEGSRFRSITGDQEVHKTSFELPNGQTMIERTVQMYAEVGVRRFVALVYHNASSVRDVLGDGSELGVEIIYSEDPGKPVGRGGAIRHALEQGLVPEGSHLIAHNPDDQIVGDTKELLQSLIGRYMQMVGEGSKASVVVVPGAPYEFSGVQVQDGTVMAVEARPFIPLPAHIGVTFLSPEALAYFDEKQFPYDQKLDFEPVVLPLLQEQAALTALDISQESWISVNNEKGYKKLLAALEGS